MIVWSVANQKGGVGKTTTTVSLAAGIAAHGARVLVVDLDPHGSLTGYCGYHPEQVEPNLFQLFGGEFDARPMPPLASPWDSIHLWPASSALATLDRRMGAGQGMGLKIRDALAAVADRFDFALIDCPPMLGILMVNALGACDRLLVPVQTEHLALQGLERMVRTLDMVHKSRKRELAWTVIPTLFDRRTRASRDALLSLRHQYRDRIWPGIVPMDTRFRDASVAGQPIQLHAPGSRGSLAYGQLLEYLLGLAQSEKLPQRAAG